MTWAARAASAVSAARELLRRGSADGARQNMDALAQAVRHLEEAAEAIGELIRAGPSPADRAPLEHLRGEVRVMGRMLAAAAEFYAGMSWEAGAAAPGYPGRGGAPEAAAKRRLALEG